MSSEVADGVELGGNAGVNMWCRWQEYRYQVLQRGLNVAWQSNSRKDEVCGPGAFFRRVGQQAVLGNIASCVQELLVAS